MSIIITFGPSPLPSPGALLAVLQNGIAYSGADVLELTVTGDTFSSVDLAEHFLLGYH